MGHTSRSEVRTSLLFYGQLLLITTTRKARVVSLSSGATGMRHFLEMRANSPCFGPRPVPRKEVSSWIRGFCDNWYQYVTQAVSFSA